MTVYSNIWLLTLVSMHFEHVRCAYASRVYVHGEAPGCDIIGINMPLHTYHIVLAQPSSSYRIYVAPPRCRSRFRRALQSMLLPQRLYT
jgi:hypothetical protein